MAKNIDAVIFDFDGTLADSFEIFMESLAEVLGRPAFTEAEIAELRGLSVHAVAKKLNVKRWQIPRFAVRGRRAIAARMYRVKLFEGVPEAVTQLHGEYKLFILSSNSEASIRDLLKQYDLEDKIDGIYAGTSILGKAKRLQGFLKKERLEASRCVYVGDEIRDIEASHQVGMKCVAVEWGYADPAALKTHNPDALISKPASLSKTISTI